jgi:hypothetical protein
VPSTVQYLPRMEGSDHPKPPDILGFGLNYT